MVVISAVRSPLRSISALVTIVVPWTMSSSSGIVRPDCREASVNAVSIARDGSFGVVSVLPMVKAPVTLSTMMRSVNVPPMSTPARKVDCFFTVIP